MKQLQIDAAQDDSFADQLLPILFVATIGLATVLLGTVALNDHLSRSAWGFPIALFVAVYLASEARGRGQPRRAGQIMSCALSLLPALTVPLFGLNGNPLLFLSSLGVIVAALTVSARAAAYLAGAVLVLLIAQVSIVGGAERTSWLWVIALLLTGTAALSAGAAKAIRDTIVWALDAAAKSNRREELLRATQVELQEAIYERDRLNTRLQRLNKDLEAARIVAEAAYRAKASFMATMSHELRTPLNLIIGFSTAMVEHPEMYDGQHLPQLYHDDVAEIRRSSQHLLGLINDILDLAKVEAGRLELHTKVMTLDTLLQEALKTGEGLLIGRPVTLRREFDIGLAPVLADEVRVRQVLLNLLSNASKFTDVGEIGLGAHADEREVVVWVRDTGVGIAPEDQARVFGEFEQVEQVDNNHRGGTGLGLSICRWLIQLHGGRMWVESKLGKGSTFYFTLPVAGSALTSQPEVLADSSVVHSA